MIAGAWIIATGLACTGMNETLDQQLDDLQEVFGPEPSPPEFDALVPAESLTMCTQEEELQFEHAIQPVRAGQALSPLPDNEWLVTTIQTGTMRFEKLSEKGLTDLGIAPRSAEPHVSFGEQVWVVGGEEVANDITVSRVRPARSKTRAIRPKGCNHCLARVNDLATVGEDLWLAGWVEEPPEARIGWLARLDRDGRIVEEHRLAPRGAEAVGSEINTIHLTRFGLLLAGRHARALGAKRDTAWLGRFSDGRTRWAKSTKKRIVGQAAPAFRVDRRIHLAFPTMSGPCGHHVAIEQHDLNGNLLEEAEIPAAGPTEPWSFLVLSTDSVVAVGQGPDLSHVVRTTFEGATSGARFRGLTISDIAVEGQIRLAGNGTEAIVGTLVY